MAALPKAGGERLRDALHILPGMEGVEGAGVRIRRYIGSPMLDHLDPFLLLDEFRSADPRDYEAGFPTHPHRGFQTLTYMIEGKFRHEDSTGSKGVLTGGGLQWMNAGSGVLHSEMPAMKEGQLWGYQLWLNAPAREKMGDPFYRDFKAKEVRGDEVRKRLLAGGGQESHAHYPVLYEDVRLKAGASFRREVPAEMNGFLVVAEGEISFGPRRVRMPGRTMAVFGPGDSVALDAAQDSTLLLAAAPPLREPVARWGPFVMNTPQELGWAVEDYQAGRLVKKRAENR
jgi:redox-sensitive bicupin YhaK (pirin superfamily)